MYRSNPMSLETVSLRDYPADREEISTFEGLSLNFEDVALATNGFRIENPWQSTGSVTTYRGLLTVFPYEITLKIYFENSFGKRKLRTELRASKLCQHQNVVRCFGGRSMKGGKFLAIYESLSYGTLQGLLYADATERISWDTRLKIALDIANGLAYLHEDLDSDIHLVHCDLSASAIFYSGLTAKIGRFELSRLVKHNAQLQASERIPLGKLGYMPPEMIMNKVTSRRGDVYSFGVIILELITRRHPYKPGWSSEGLRTSFASEHDLSTIIDLTLVSELDSIRESVLALLVDVGLRCTETNPLDRPTMKEIVVTLQTIISMRGTEQSSIRYSPAHEQLFGYSNRLPGRVNKILHGSEQEKSTYFRKLYNLQIRLLFDDLDGNDQCSQYGNDPYSPHSHGILPFIRKQCKKLSSRFRRKKECANACRNVETEREDSATGFDEIEQEQEFLSIVIIGKRKQGNEHWHHAQRVLSPHGQNSGSQQGRHENMVEKSRASRGKLLSP